MLWVSCWMGLLLVSAIGLVACANRVRFARRVASEVRDLLAGSSEPMPVDRARLAAIPLPVRRYLERALGSRARAVRTVRLRHGGRSERASKGAGSPSEASSIAADPPGFVWHGRITMMPGLWVEARDRSTGGEGQMLVRAESTFTLADSRGPELDQGALLRLLGEMVWFPTAFSRRTLRHWEALTIGGPRPSCASAGARSAASSSFGEDGMPAPFQADRYRDVGGGQSVLTPFRGECANFRDETGLLVPHHMTAWWHVDGKAVPYARFIVDTLDYDETEPF